jgi:hypothetical protein
MRVPSNLVKKVHFQTFLPIQALYMRLTSALNAFYVETKTGFSVINEVLPFSKPYSNLLGPLKI